MNIYMTVGLGSFGKSTYCNKFFNKEDIISMDKIVGKDSITLDYYNEYIKLINNYTIKKKQI